MTETPKTAEEALQTILGDLTVEEFNNILTAILGFSRMLETEISDQPEAMAELEEEL